MIGRKLAVLELAKPIEMLGNASTIPERIADMTIMEQGVYAVGKKTGKEILIFNADCIAAQLKPAPVEVE